MNIENFDYWLLPNFRIYSAHCAQNGFLSLIRFQKFSNTVEPIVIALMELAFNQDSF